MKKKTIRHTKVFIKPMVEVNAFYIISEKHFIQAKPEEVDLRGKVYHWEKTTLDLGFWGRIHQGYKLFKKLGEVRGGS